MSTHRVITPAINWISVEPFEVDPEQEWGLIHVSVNEIPDEIVSRLWMVGSGKKWQFQYRLMDSHGHLTTGAIQYSPECNESLPEFTFAANRVTHYTIACSIVASADISTTRVVMLTPLEADESSDSSEDEWVETHQSIDGFQESSDDDGSWQYPGDSYPQLMTKQDLDRELDEYRAAGASDNYQNQSWAQQFLQRQRQLVTGDPNPIIHDGVDLEQYLHNLLQQARHNQSEDSDVEEGSSQSSEELEEVPTRSGDGMTAADRAACYRELAGQW